MSLQPMYAIRVPNKIIANFCRLFQKDCTFPRFHQVTERKHAGIPLIREDTVRPMDRDQEWRRLFVSFETTS